ncbi:MAG: tetratricopeptide repeat protein [Sphaerospermopsis sp. SIO1G1]|nr:tetratricopeptide repeat protein [Sphaerospermopsis sp. SIO1G1]
MLEEISIAFERQDYQTAAKLLKPLIKESGHDPWVHFYVARLQEVSGKHQEAEKIYRQLLKATINSKVLSQARQGLKRLEDFAKAEKQKAIAEATAEPNNTEQGILVLEPINSEQRTSAAKELARIMEIDPYSARLVLPSRSWRVYRIGKIGEMQFYGKQLQQSHIPCFWLKLSHIQNIQVYQVKYFSQSSKNPHVFCTSADNQLGTLSFSWSEVTAKVMGLLPIFEQVVDLNVRGKLERKTQTQDYAHFCDLHLPGRKSILRIHDSSYNFQEGLEISPNATHNTIRINWNNLINWLNENTLKTKTWSDFQPFGEGVLDQTETLRQIPTHIQINRRENSNWDAAFHLYSGIIFAKSAELN